jgi:LysM repeat protein
MAKPAYTSDAMWNFWLKFDKKYPATKLGGTYANKPGYHNRRSALRGWDYSKDEFQKDRLGSSELCAAIDLTMSPAAMKTFSARLLASGKDKNDPRGNYLREFFGTINGTKVTGWDFQKLSLTSSDSSHLWHIHVSIVRAYAADPRAYDALYSILTGESVLKWKIRNKLTSVVKPKPPTPPAKVYYTCKSGDTLTSIAAKCHTTVATLIKLNPQKKKNPDALNVGEKIRVK